MVGELLDALNKSEYANNTIVVIFSDHGWQLGEKQHWRKFGLWQNILNSVLMIKSPEGAPGLVQGSQNGTRCEANVSLEDIFPTLTELCGVTNKQGVSGTSLVAQLKDAKTTRSIPVISCFGEAHISVIKDHWHYILYDGKEEELYHMKKDPEEWANLANDKQYNAIKQTLKAMIPQHRHPKVPTENVNWDEIIKGKLPY
jgi:arylsulfatase A-like enzyme